MLLQASSLKCYQNMVFRLERVLSPRRWRAVLCSGERAKNSLRELLSIAAGGNKDIATFEKCKPGAGLVTSLCSAAGLPALRQNANARAYTLSHQTLRVCVCPWQTAGGGCAQTSLPWISPASGYGHHLQPPLAPHR